jgi:arylsulfatase A-like enzyme
MEKRRPNIVFIITDDQGYGDLGCHHNSIIHTPNINKLYDESTRFTDYHVGPTCAPTRAGLMTGRYHNSTGVWHTIGGRSLLRKNEVSLAELMRRNGYRTGIFGKWHLGDNYPYRPHDRGFEEAIVHGGGGIGQTPDYWGNDYFDDTYFDKGTPRKFEGYCTDVFFSLAKDFISRHRESPFFCYISTNAPHSPYQVEDKYADLYRGQVPEERARFYGMITNIDENVGKLREWLQQEGLDEDTIVIFMTDNGTSEGCSVDNRHVVIEGENAGMRGKKSSPYEGGHRVPFFLHSKSKGFVNGKDVTELCANIDVLPTLADLCSLDIPDELDLDGVSLVRAMEGDGENLHNRIIVTDSQRVPQPLKWKDSSTMLAKWRLINGRELYNIEEDPGQSRDVAAEHPHIVDTLYKGYETWWRRVSKQFDEEIPISIGSDQEPVTCITAHDWRGDGGDVAWNQGEIRSAKICNSYVEIEVEQAGMYSFELRRWPHEENRYITEGIEGELVGWFSGGKAVSVHKATLKIRDYEQSLPVSDSDAQVSFLVDLEIGPAHLQTWLEDEQGILRGAYYVYVRKVQ